MYYVFVIGLGWGGRHVYVASMTAANTAVANTPATPSALINHGRPTMMPLEWSYNEPDTATDTRLKTPWAMLRSREGESIRCK